MQRDNARYASQKVNSYWNSPLCIAEYDATHAQGIGAKLDDQVWQEEFRTYLPPAPTRVLDLGCGTGFASLLLAKMGYEVTGLDQSENMLREARQKATARGVQATFVQGDAVDTGLPHGSFDIVLARWVFWTLPDPAAAVRHARKLLAPGGMLAVFDGNWFKNPECTGDKDQPPRSPENEKDRLWASVYTPEFLASLPLLGDDPQAVLAAFMQDAGFIHITRSGMPYVSEMYRRHRGPHWQEEQMYVVRGLAPKS